MIDFLAVLREKRDLIWPEIERYLDLASQIPSYCRLPAKYKPEVSFHFQLIADYPKRQGKYVRPTLVLLTAEAMGFPQDKAIRTASAMEVSDNWILNHDDIEDDSLERRGKPTLHRIYGKELAINAGDGLHILMWKILRDNEEIIGTEKTLAIIDEFYQMLNRTVLGQTIEIKWTQENRIDLTDEDILLILESKTGYYTIAGPMRLGAILAGGNQDQLDRLYQFGKLMGYCYQITDDLLDLTSDFAGLKKQTGNDIYEGKRTIMLLHLFRTIKGKAKQRLMSIMAKTREEKSEAEVKWVIEMMEKYGSLTYGREMLAKFITQAKEYFDQELDFLTHQPARDQIRAFIDFVAQRSY